MSILKIDDVMKLTGLGRSTIYILAKQGKFPRPVKLSVRSSGWFEKDVAEWLESKRPAPSVVGEG